MAERVEENEQLSNGNVSHEDLQLGSIYSLEECQEIGKGMIDALKSAMKPVETYLPAMQEPHARAWRYLEERHVLRMLEILLARLVYERPGLPLQFMMSEIEKMRGQDLENLETFVKKT